MALNVKQIDTDTLETTLSVLLKHESDLQRANRMFQRSARGQSDEENDPRLRGWRN